MFGSKLNYFRLSETLRIFFFHVKLLLCSALTYKIIGHPTFVFIKSENKLVKRKYAGLNDRMVVQCTIC